MKGNSELITAAVVDEAERHFEALKGFLEKDGFIDPEEFELLRSCKRVETRADIANLTVRLMKLGLHRDGIGGERFGRMLKALSEDLERLNPEPDDLAKTSAA